VAVTRDQIRHIAALAELAVDDAAAAELERQLTRILDYVRQLEGVEAGEPHVVAAGAARLRPDGEASDPLQRAPPDFAPAMAQGLFVVPRLGALGGGGEES